MLDVTQRTVKELGSMLDWLASIFSSEGFPARWDCGAGWAEAPYWGWIHIVSDLFTWGAYTAIPIVLVYFLGKRRDLPFPKLFWLFGAFILACGTVHLLESVIFWVPLYRLSAIVKLATAVVSCATVVALLPVIPVALTLRTPKQLESELAIRVNELERTNQQLELVTATLEEQSERLRLALEAGGMGTWDLDLKTNLTQLDEGEAELLGVPFEDGPLELEGFYNLLHPDDLDSVEQGVRDAVERDTPYEREFRIVRSDGTLRWLAGRAVVLRDDRGIANRMVGVNYDLTDRIKQAEMLKSARHAAEESSRSKSEFLANMSHEIRTPMTAIFGCVDTLLPRIHDGEQFEVVQMIRQQGQHLLGLLNDVLDLSKIEAGRLDVCKEPCSIVAIAEEVRSLLGVQANQKQIDLELQIDEAMPPRVMIDPLRVRQILLNLVGNALKFTDAGRVCVDISFDESFNPPMLRIDVSDTGCGIDESQREEIFEAFSQGSNAHKKGTGGTGLGLAICQRLVSMMNGEIRVESQVDEGSKFLVTIPAEATNEAVEAATEQEPAERGEVVDRELLKTLRILVAEDTPGIQFILRRLVEPAVGEVVIVADGQQAIDAYKAAREQGSPYDLLVLDMQMPVLTGYDAARILRERGCKTPILALTAQAMRGDREKCLAVGCNDYLPKPIDRDKLLEKLTQLATGQSDA